MRKLMYDCISGSRLVKTVASFKEAQEWREKDEDNEVVTRLEKIEEELTEEQIKARDKRIEKINKATKATD